MPESRQINKNPNGIRNGGGEDKQQTSQSQSSQISKQKNKKSLGCFSCCTANPKPDKKAYGKPLKRQGSGMPENNHEGEKQALTKNAVQIKSGSSSSAIDQTGPKIHILTKKGDKDQIQLQSPSFDDEEENNRGEALVAGQMSDGASQRGENLQMQKTRTDHANLQSALEQLGMQYEQGRSQSHGMILTPSEHKQLQQIINKEPEQDATINNNNFEENVPVSARSGINGIANIEIQKTLGLQGTMSKQSIQIHQKSAFSNENYLDEEYTSGRKTPPQMKESEHDRSRNNKNKNMLALTDIKIQMLNDNSGSTQNLNAIISNNQMNGLFHSDVAQLKGSNLLAHQFNTFDLIGNNVARDGTTPVNQPESPIKENSSSFTAGPPKERKSNPIVEMRDVSPKNMTNGSRPNSNLRGQAIGGSGTGSGGTVVVEGSQIATSQAKLIVNFDGTGVNSLNSKNSKNSAPSMNDINVKAEENKNENNQKCNTGTVTGSKSGSKSGGKDGWGRSISPASPNNAFVNPNQTSTFNNIAADAKAYLAESNHRKYSHQDSQRDSKQKQKENLKSQRSKSQVQPSTVPQNIPKYPEQKQGNKSALGMLNKNSQKQIASDFSDQNQEDFDNVDESEVENDGEEKAHDKVNQIPNSQVTRQQKEVNSSTVHIQGSIVLAATIKGNQNKNGDNSSIMNSQTFENAQQYTMKSLTLNNIGVGNSSSDNQPGMFGGGQNSSQTINQGPVGLYYVGGTPNSQMMQQHLTSGMVRMSQLTQNLYGYTDAGQYMHAPSNEISKRSNSNQNIFDMHSSGNGYQVTQQYQNGVNNVGAAQSHQGTSSNRKHVIIGGNGQISPVSHNSMINFTENDNKFSFGSYAPSHISSFGVGMGNNNSRGNQMDIEHIRMSLLNFATNQLQMQNSHSGSGGTPGTPQNNNKVGNSVNSHRPLHEQESIEREIRKNSRINNPQLVTSPKNNNNNSYGVHGGVQVPIQGRPNLQKVFMLNDIILQQPQVAYGGYFGQNQNLLPSQMKKNTSGTSAERNEKKVKDQDQDKKYTIDLDKKTSSKVVNVNLNINQQDSKISNPNITSATAANSAIGGTSANLGSNPFYAQSQLFAPNKVNLDQLLPISIVENFYHPIIKEKSYEIDRITRQVRAHKKERYALARQSKNQKFQQKAMAEENINLRKQINQLLIAQLCEKTFVNENEAHKQPPNQRSNSSALNKQTEQFTSISSSNSKHESNFKKADPSNKNIQQ